MKTQKNSSWLERVEELIHILEGSSIGELELEEGDTEIIIRRQPGMVLVSSPTQGSPATGPAAGAATQHIDRSVAIVAPLTGVYYAAASPTTPPFVNIGDVVHVGQVVALVEAMKVFNEITATTAGRVTALPSTNGNVVQKGDVLLRIDPQ
jgi:acetyl-CoA carboxylase biotin carboxyl carrier protein